MTDTKTHRDWVGRDLYDSDGDKVGTIEDIYLDDDSGQPEWVTVSTGWFGTARQFVPIAGTSAHDDGLRVSATTDMIKDAPSIDDDGHLSEADERRLYEHYGFDFESTDHEATYGGRERADEGFEYADTTAADASAVTRSEEEVSVDKREREAGRVRLRKYVVTEDVDVTVPVKKQVARVVRTTTDGEGNIATEDTDEEIVLTEEELVVDKKTVAKENVRLETDTVVEDEHVTESVRKERVEVEGDVDDNRK